LGKVNAALEKLIDEYLAFQRGRPDLPQGNLSALSDDELEQLVTAFSCLNRIRMWRGRQHDPRIFTDRHCASEPELGFSSSGSGETWP
jgi:hypothetical protein